MARITVDELLERKISELKGDESEKKKELQEIQAELRRNQKALEVLTGDSSTSNKKAKSNG